MKLAEAFAPLVDLVYPPRCPSCGEGLAAQDGLCAACWGELAFPGDPACALCQRPFGSGTVAEGAICAPCLANSPRHDGVAAGTLYNDASRKLVLAFKHGKRIALAPMLARVIAARLPELEGEWLVVPVPLHAWRLWRRGFNQSALLAREIARLRGQPVVVDALVRKKPTPTLGGLGRAARSAGFVGSDRRQSSPGRQAQGSESGAGRRCPDQRRYFRCLRPRAQGSGSGAGDGRVFCQGAR
jgi:predicted amidophosphoribosyltransferase